MNQRTGPCPARGMEWGLRQATWKMPITKGDCIAAQEVAIYSLIAYD